ncbi:MAG: hypothetical protein HQL47_04335 [Gammaproteobacteria bacterium]|nr:hypothetical protein [Gammaproteobacteria bacterium]
MPKPMVLSDSTVDLASKTREDVQVVRASVVVEDVDLTKRVLKVKNADGEIFSLKVPAEVKRLDEIKKGDSIHINYYMSIAYQLRKPTPEELKNPGSLEGVAVKADATEAPGFAGMGVLNVITTIEAIDNKSQTVVLMGPQGGTIKVKAHEPKVLAGLKIGDTVVVTLSEGLVIDIEAGK